MERQKTFERDSTRREAPVGVCNRFPKQKPGIVMSEIFKTEALPFRTYGHMQAPNRVSQCTELLSTQQFPTRPSHMPLVLKTKSGGD